MPVESECIEFELIGFTVIGVVDLGRDIAKSRGKGVIDGIVATSHTVLVDGGFATAKRKAAAAHFV